MYVCYVRGIIGILNGNCSFARILEMNSDISFLNITFEIWFSYFLVQGKLKAFDACIISHCISIWGGAILYSVSVVLYKNYYCENNARVASIFFQG